MIGAGAVLIALALIQGSERVEVDPVTCWWRTSAAAVRVGEPFGVILTCSLLQTEAARVVADESRLEAAVVQLQPFEVIGGNRAEDVVTNGRRFLQYEYRLRALAENVFASVVAVPALELSYRVESRVAEGNAVAGRDRTYLLPPLTMRVVSLVPDSADDIREAPVATFAEIEALDSRSTMFRAAGSAAIAVGVLVLAAAAVGGLRRRRAARAPAHRPVRPGAVLAVARRDLLKVRDEVRAAGWTDDLVGRALGAVRIVVAYATGRPVLQRPVARNVTVAPGEVVVARGGSAVAVSSTLAATPDEELQSALARFDEVRYGRAGTADRRLDEALETVLERAERLMAARHFRERLWTRWRR